MILFGYVSANTNWYWVRNLGNQNSFTALIFIIIIKYIYIEYTIASIVKVIAWAALMQGNRLLMP